MLWHTLNCQYWVGFVAERLLGWTLRDIFNCMNKEKKSGRNGKVGILQCCSNGLRIFAFWIIATTIVQAQTWTNTIITAQNGLLNWGSAANWSPNVVPNGTDTIAVFSNSPNLTINNGQTFTNGMMTAPNSGQAWIVKYGTGTNYLQTSSGTPTLNVGSSGTTAWFQSAYLGGAQGFLKSGAGKVTFRYNNNFNSISGPIIVGSGTLGFQIDGNFGNENNGITISNGAYLILESANVTPLSVTLPSTRTITLAGTQAQIGVLSSAYSLILACPINESAAGSGLLWNSAGELVLSNANTFTGPLTITAGTNDLANSNAAQFSTVTLNGGVLQFDQAISGKNFTLGGLAGSLTGLNVALQNNAPTPAAITLTVGGNNSSNLFLGNLTGLGSLVKAGSGSLTLLGTNTYAGTTTINAGRLVVSTSSILPGAINLADGATNCVQVVGAGQTLTNGTLTLGTIAGGTMEFNNQVLANPTSPMLIATNLIINGTTKVNITGPAFAYYVGTIPLLAYGSKSGGGTWMLNSLPMGMTASLNDTGSQLELIITAVNNPVVTESVSFSPTNAGVPINPAFCGFSYEKSQMTGNLFVSTDTSLLGMMSQLGSGVLRIGAASVDSTCWNGLSNCPAITPAQVDAFAGFVNALPTNWSVIYSVNQVSNTAANCASEAAYAANALGSRLLGLEIGNEPDLYHDYYRTNTYSYANFLSEWQPFVASITNTVPGWAVTNHGIGWTITGPATSWNVSGYTLPFVTNEAKVISMATHHYYRDGATSTNATMAELLASDTNLPVTVSNIVAAANHFNLPQGFRMDESGSFSGGGNTNSAQYGSALWTLDVMFTIAINGGQGINFHGGGSGTSSYTPIADNGTSVVQARPEYYGMKLFSLAAHGSAVPVVVSPAPGINFAAYGIRYTNGALGAMLNNKDATNGVQVTINLGTNVAAAQAMVLTGPALNATVGYTLGGAMINPDGSWSGGFQYDIPATNGQLTLTVLPMTAVWLNPLLPPVLAAITNRFIIAGATLSVTNQATDPNFPAQALGFALATKPSGAMINAANGLVNWRPPVTISGTSNQFTVVVTNISGLAATQSFWAGVITPQKPVMAAPNYSAGSFNVTISGSAGPDYIIQGTANLASPSWQGMLTNLSPVLPFQWTDTNTARPQFYYRVLLGP